VADQADNQLSDGRSVQDKIDGLKQRVAELQTLEEEVNSHPDKQISIVDPDARLMKTRGMTRSVCYNLQTAVDPKHHLIVAYEVTNKQDRGLLCQVGKQVQIALEKKKITVIADKGYFNGPGIKDTQDAGMTALVPKGDTSGSEKKGIFNRTLFRYDADKDVYICPANQDLTYRFSG
jgi:hypothetical protein